MTHDPMVKLGVSTISWSQALHKRDWVRGYMLVRSSKLKFVYIWRSKKQWIGWCAELLTTSKCTNAKCKVQVAISLAVVEVQKAVKECAEQVCRAKLEVSGEYQKGWFT